MNKNDIHPIQSWILCDLLFAPEASFSQLNKKKLSSDQFSFHLHQLTDWKLIEKTEAGKYRLTTTGKEYANRFDTEAAEVERQPKLGVLVIGMKKENGQTYYLTQQRLKQPYYGFWGFVTGKVRWGEKAKETAIREFSEETGMAGEMVLIGVRHKIDFSSEGKLLEDKYFLTFLANKTSGKLIEKFEGGANQWMSKEELFKQEDVFDDAEEVIEMVEKRDFGFDEKEYRVKRY